MSFFINFGGVSGGTGGGDVSAVNGKTGDVILNYNDVNAVANILKTCGGIQVGMMSERPTSTDPNVLYVVTDTIPNEFYRYDNDTSTWEQIGGGASGSLLAVNVKFDNTNTTLSATNIQDAIEDIVNALENAVVDINTNTNEITRLKLEIGSGKVKVNANDTLDYLGTKIDGTTIKVVSDKLVVKTLDGLNATTEELNYSVGLKSNIQTQIDGLSNVGNFTGSVDNHSDLSNLTDMAINDMVIVIEDETHNDVSTIYMYDGANWQYIGEFKVEMRDFTTDPIDLKKEVTGKLPAENIDSSVVLDTEIDVGLLNKFTQDNDKNLLFDGEMIGSDGSVHGSVKQLIRKNVIAPETVKLNLPNLNTFSGVPLEVLTLEEGQKNVVNQLDNFDNENLFEDNDYIEVDGKLKLKNEYEYGLNKIYDNVYSKKLIFLDNFKEWETYPLKKHITAWNASDKSSMLILKDDVEVTEISQVGNVRSVKSRDQGKYYSEHEIIDSNPSNRLLIGIANSDLNINTNFSSIAGAVMFICDGRIFQLNTIQSGLSAPVIGDIVGIGVDFDIRLFNVFINGVLIGSYTYTNSIQSAHMFVGRGTAAGSKTGVKSNFGDSEFELSRVNPILWEQMVQEGYKPYDYENSIWSNNGLLRKNNDIFGYDNYSGLSNLTSNILDIDNISKQEFQTYGFDVYSPFTKNILPNLNEYSILISADLIPDKGIYSSVDAIPYPQFIIQKENIDIPALQQINTLILNANESGDGIVRTIFSVDNGTTWKTYDALTETFVSIDITNIENVKDNGIDTVTFNLIGIKWNDIIQEGKVRFAYYIEQDDITDIAEITQLRINMDYTDAWVKSVHPTDYGYKFDNKGAYVTFNTDGTFKVNYIELAECSEGEDIVWEDF